MSSSLLRLALAWSLALLLVACAGNKTRPGKPAQPVPPPVYEPLDGPPTIPFDVDSIPEPVPQIEPRSRYGNTSPYVVLGKRYTVMDNARGYVERGVASWYGTKFHGRLTSNREPYDMFAFTAAHKSLPLPTYVRVTNLDNGKSVVVRVNDRGPFHSERLIDLSYAAAVKLGYMETGTARVEVEVIDVAGVDDRRGSTAGDYRFLQLGAYSSPDKARNLQDALQALLASPVFISEVQSGESLLYRVRVGPMTAAGELQSVQQQLRTAGYDAGQPLP